MEKFQTTLLLPSQWSASSKLGSKSRKSHKKSRLGCVNCKARRLKLLQGPLAFRQNEKSDAQGISVTKVNLPVSSARVGSYLVAMFSQLPGRHPSKQQAYLQ